jgi:predicted transcriptional regulator
MNVAADSELVAALNYALTLQSHPALAVLVCLVAEADHNHQCSTSYEDIAQTTGIKSRVTITRAIRTLMDRGILSRIRRQAGSVVYTIHLAAISGLSGKAAL